MTGNISTIGSRPARCCRTSYSSCIPRSPETGLRELYGDGDSKSFSGVENIYGPEKKVTKFECIGHYQKRVGSRLRKLKKSTKGLGGKGRLTDAKIDTLQNYFGIALRQNVGNLEMVNACMASMYHVAEYHERCPKGNDTWCQFQKVRTGINRKVVNHLTFERPFCQFMLPSARKKC